MLRVNFLQVKSLLIENIIGGFKVLVNKKGVKELSQKESLPHDIHSSSATLSETSGQVLVQLPTIQRAFLRSTDDVLYKLIDIGERKIEDVSVQEAQRLYQEEGWQANSTICEIPRFYIEPVIAYIKNKLHH